MNKWTTMQLEEIRKAIEFALHNDDDLTFPEYADLANISEDIRQELDRRRLWGE